MAPLGHGEQHAFPSLAVLWAPEPGQPSRLESLGWDVLVASWCPLEQECIPLDSQCLVLQVGAGVP